jgi:hypothetical protein
MNGKGRKGAPPEPKEGGATRASSFKECSYCGASWASRDTFLGDSRISLVGYQASFEDLQAGPLLFNHACGTTLAVAAAQFQDLYDGPVFSDRLFDSAECPAYCLLQSELRTCPARCECAWVREVIQILKNWPKDS